MLISALRSALRTPVRRRVFLLRFNSTIPSLRMDSLFPTCKSCGIKLQNENASQPGFYTKSTPKPLEKKEDEVFDKHMAALSPEDRKLLIGNFEPAPTEDEVAVSSNEVSCVRCRGATFKSKFDLSEFPVESVDQVLSRVPPAVPLVYVLSAQDFPLSLSEDVFRFRRPEQIKFIITKTDLIFRSAELAARYGATFYRDYLWRKYKVPPHNVDVVSGAIEWDVKRLKFADNSHIIGHVNSGKSTLISSVVYHAMFAQQQREDRRPNSRLRDKAERQHPPPLITTKTKQGRKLRKHVDLWKQRYGPGASHVPGFTRGIIPYEVADFAVIYDVPGFTTDTSRGHGLFDIVDPRQAKTLTRGRALYDHGDYKSRYDTIRKDQVYTLGGLFLLEAPGAESTSMLRVRNCINFDPEVFHSAEKFFLIMDQIESSPLKDRILVRGQTYKKYLIPPFHGSIDLVFKYLGHVNITATGAKQESQKPIAVYLPPQIEAIVRRPIARYIQKTPTGLDAKGNPLRKENIRSKSVMALQRYTGGKFYSRLIPADSIPEGMSESEYVNQENGFDMWIEAQP